jgi:glucosamine kinase
MPAVLGVDAGGSHTEAVVCDRSLTVLGRARGDPGNLRPGEVAQSAAAILAAARRAHRSAGSPPLAGAVVGAAGAGHAERSAALSGVLAAELGCAVRVVTDGEIALQAAFGSGPGILLAAGSGAIAFARDPAGTLRRAGGFGWRVGDEGSAYWIARRALEAVGRALDGRGPVTALTQALARAADRRTGGPADERGGPADRRTGGRADGTEATAAELLAWAHAAGTREIAALAVTVSEAADRGDAVAMEILSAAANELATHVTALGSWFSGTRPVSVALTGSVLAEGTRVRRELIRQLSERLPHASIVAGMVDAPLGAARLAWDAATPPTADPG